MRKLFLKFINAKPWVAVLAGIISAMVFSFLISGIINLVFYYYI